MHSTDGAIDEVVVETVVMQAMIAMAPASAERICVGLQTTDRETINHPLQLENPAVLALDPRIVTPYERCQPHNERMPRDVPIVYEADVAAHRAWKELPHWVSHVERSWLMRQRDAGFVLAGARFGECGRERYLFALKDTSEGPKVVDTLDVGLWCVY